jgi:hypothetical protein
MENQVNRNYVIRGSGESGALETGAPGEPGLGEQGTGGSRHKSQVTSSIRVHSCLVLN